MTSLEIFGFINTVILFLLCLIIAVKFIGRQPVAPPVLIGTFAPVHVFVGLFLIVPSAVIAAFLAWYLNEKLISMSGLEIFSIVYGIFIGLFSLYTIPADTGSNPGHHKQRE
jgi:hypothetical protein